LARGCGEQAGGDAVVVVDLGGGLAGKGPQNSTGILTRCPLKEVGAARNRVSRAGQSKPSPM
jgi:hypothetical protein